MENPAGRGRDGDGGRDDISMTVREFADKG
jgi:hypothetical protein